ncbi:MAG: GntG family PLP-dependent aldolase, partial [Pseudomonadota bacterium]
DGSLPLEKISAAVKADDFHFARTRLLALENTIGGKVLPADYVTQATDLAREHGLATHLDGARLFNAAVASNTPLKNLCLPFDSISLCFSKGLGAPIGSVLVGSQAFIDRARRWRKVVGGGMRQSGVIAAACQYALEHNVDSLADDHRRAEQLADALSALPGVELAYIATNMLFVRFPTAQAAPLTAWLKEHDILLDPLYADGKTRLVIHQDISARDIEKVIEKTAAYFSRQ